MTGAPPALDRPALRAALAEMRIDPPSRSDRFESALALLKGWNIRFAERVVDEYRRFLYLAATAGFEATPSQFVDEAWHLHLTLPHYREILCGRILGRPLEHRPGTGTAEDAARCARQYEQTLALYERVFEEPAPVDIWPRPAPEEQDPRWWQGRESQLAAALVILPFGLASLAIGIHEFGWTLVALATVFGLTFLWERRPGKGRRREGSADWDMDVGDSGGGSCGGGCGGD